MVNNQFHVTTKPNISDDCLYLVQADFHFKESSTQFSRKNDHTWEIFPDMIML